MAPNIKPGTMPVIKTSLLPREEMLEVGRKGQKLSIGIPRENTPGEDRVMLTPEAVASLSREGHQIIIETGAGLGSNYSDLDYSENAGIIVQDKGNVFQADIVLKISPFGPSEIGFMRPGQMVCSFLKIRSHTPDYFQQLLERKTIGLAYEFIRDDHQSYPVLQSMRAIEGYTAIIAAGEYLSKSHNGKGVMLGGIAGITPTDIVVLGAGTAAEYAVRAALGFGASVRVFDHSVQRLQQLQRHVGQFFPTSVFHEKVLRKSLRSADVVIGAIEHPAHERYFVTTEMVKEMKPGSVIIDLIGGEGSCIESSEEGFAENQAVNRHGVVHYVATNMPSRVARTASIALSNVIAPVIINIGELGGIKPMLSQDKGMRQGVYMYNGILTSHTIGEIYGLTSNDIELLMAAF